MAAFNVHQLDELNGLVVVRQAELNRECMKRHTPRTLKHIRSIINMDSIMERLKETCKTHNNPWDLIVPFYGYSGSHKLEPGSRVTQKDLIESSDFLYHLDEMFNGDRPHGSYRFRVTSRRVPNQLNQYNWHELVLHYYSRGVPVKLIRKNSDSREEPLPASPIPIMNPEDDDMPPLEDEVSIHENDCRCEDCCYSKGIAFQRDDDKSDHGGRCTCRECREHYVWNRNY
jgi:hypothetical protein